MIRTSAKETRGVGALPANLEVETNGIEVKSKWDSPRLLHDNNFLTSAAR